MATLNENERLRYENRRFCYRDVLNADAKFDAVLVIEGVSGHFLPREDDTEFRDFPTEKACRDFCATKNYMLGLKDDDIMDITISSMFPKSIQAELARERYGDE